MAKKEGGGAFAVAQQIGKSLFLPIAVLPPAGILLGIGSSFTNPTTIATYGLSGILHPGTFLYGLMQMFNGAGNAVFGNLALIFALAVALGMAKKEKGVAVLSAGIFYLIMLTTMNVCLQISGQIVDGVVQPGVKDGAIATAAAAFRFRPKQEDLERAGEMPRGKKIWLKPSAPGAPLECVLVSEGVSDETRTEIVADGAEALVGREAVVGYHTAMTAAKSGGKENPFAPKFPKRNQNKGTAPEPKPKAGK